MTLRWTAAVASLLALGAAPAATAAAGPVTVTAIIGVVPDCAMPGNVAESGALLGGLADAARHAPGVESFRVLRDASRPDHFVVPGVWRDMDAFAAYSGAEATRQCRHAFQPRQGGPFDGRISVSLE